MSYTILLTLCVGEQPPTSGSLSQISHQYFELNNAPTRFDQRKNAHNPFCCRRTSHSQSVAKNNSLFLPHSIISVPVVTDAFIPSQRTICYSCLTMISRTLSVHSVRFVLIFCYTISLTPFIESHSGTHTSLCQRSPLQFISIVYYAVTQPLVDEDDQVPLRQCINEHPSGFLSVYDNTKRTFVCNHSPLHLHHCIISNSFCSFWSFTILTLSCLLYECSPLPLRRCINNQPSGSFLLSKTLSQWHFESKNSLLCLNHSDKPRTHMAHIPAWFPL